MKTALVAVALLALALPGVAFAHASVRATQPSYRERLERAPRSVWVRFDQGVKALPNSIVVQSASGTVVSGVTPNGTDAHVMSTRLRSLPRGAYTVRWHAIRPTATSSRASGRSASALPRRRRPRRTEHPARRAPSTSSAGRTSSRSCC